MIRLILFILFQEFTAFDVLLLLTKFVRMGLSCLLQFYADTVRQMALHQIVAGSPLRTLCLLIAGQPADVFSNDTIAEYGTAGGVNMFQPPAQVWLCFVQTCSYFLLFTLVLVL